MKKSFVTYLMYVVAILLLAYGVYLIGGTYSEIVEYYEAYETAVPVGDTILYLIQAGLQPIIFALLTFGLGYGINEVRKLNCVKPKNEAVVKAEPQEVVDYDEMTRSELYKLAKEKGLNVTTRTKKSDIIAELEK